MSATSFVQQAEKPYPNGFYALYKSPTSEAFIGLLWRKQVAVTENPLRHASQIHFSLAFFSLWSA